MKPREIIDTAIARYDPSHVFGLFSGGHDSLCACHIASKHPRFSGCIHINTGIGIEETREFVRETCREHGWLLKEYHPPETYESLVCEQGFPGPAHHWKMYHRLKERCLRDVVRETRAPSNRSRKIVFISGRRKQESKRRMVTVDSVIKTGEKNPSPRIVWVNPIAEWTGHDKLAYLTKHRLKRNRVVEILCMSGECLCGAFAEPGELDVIRQFFPDAAAEIDRIAEKVKVAGKHCKWGERPTKKSDSRQLPLCFSCQAKADE